MRNALLPEWHRSCLESDSRVHVCRAGWRTNRLRPHPTSEFESFAARSRKPAGWLTLDADLRVRDEYFHNANMKLLPVGASNEYNQLRTRIRAWSAGTPAENAEVNACLTWESRCYSRPQRALRSALGTVTAVQRTLRVQSHRRTECY
ncbi:MAG: hypothetical protein PHQ04_02410 [Opitutaceae bacterium]|nr:hypothetical protein [Opitutaceae bacterium]